MTDTIKVIVNTPIKVKVPQVPAKIVIIKPGAAGVNGTFNTELPTGTVASSRDLTAALDGGKRMTFTGNFTGTIKDADWSTDEFAQFRPGNDTIVATLQADTLVSINGKLAGKFEIIVGRGTLVELQKIGVNDFELYGARNFIP